MAMEEIATDDIEDYGVQKKRMMEKLARVCVHSECAKYTIVCLNSGSHPKESYLFLRCIKDALVSGEETGSIRDSVHDAVEDGKVLFDRIVDHTEDCDREAAAGSG